MEGDNRLHFDAEVCKVLYLANKISEYYEYPCITDVACFIALMLYEDQPLFNRLINAGITEQEIQEATIVLLRKYHSLSMEQKFTKNLDVTVTDLENNQKTLSFNVSLYLISIFRFAQFIAKKYYARDFFSCKELLAAFSDRLTKVYEDFLQQFPVIYPEPINNLEKFKEENNMNDKYSLPREMAGFLTVLNNDFSPDETTCDILGRDKEIRDLIKTLAKETKRNSVLTGYAGVGKTAVVEGFTWMVVTGNCPDKFKDSLVVSLDVNAMIAGTHFRGTAEERFDKLTKFLEQNPNCILFIDEIHTILGAGACREGEMDLANSLKPILARGTTRVIGATTEEEYEKYFSKDSALKRRFERLEVKEPKIHEVYPMIKNKIEKLSISHNVSISRDVIDKIIFFASVFNKETRNPDRSLDLIDKAMASAELFGRKEVKMEDVFEIFDSNYKKFDKTLLRIKIALAYHEAGHYLVHRYSDELYNMHTIALSIMPAEEYYGAHIYEYDNDVMPSMTLEYYIQLAACSLAGRVAEKMYSSKLSAGASSDLANATRIAKNVVTKFGLVDELSSMRSYSLDKKDSIITQKDISRMSKEIDKILLNSYAYAERILNEHYAELEVIVEALLDKRMLSDADLNKLLAPFSSIVSD